MAEDYRRPEANLVAVDGGLSYRKPYNPSSGVKQLGPRVGAVMQ
jgi:hypothetical protein